MTNIYVERAGKTGEVAARYAQDVDAKARFPHEAFAEIKAARLLSMALPLELGGDGADLSDVAEVCAFLGQHCSATGMIFAMHQIKLSSLISHGVGDDWHRGYMREVAKDQLLLGSATTEAGIGGDLRNSICAVEAKGKTFKLTKDASVISYGKDCDSILITARRTPDSVSSDQVMVVLKKDQYTLEKTQNWDTLGMRGTCSEGFIIHGQAPLEQILPQPFAEIAAQSMLATCHIFWASLWCGMAAGALMKAQNFVRAEARRRNVTPPGARHLADAAAKLQLARSTTLEGIHQYLRCQSHPELLESMAFAVSMNNVKTSTADVCVDVVKTALEITGIWGYRNDSQYSVSRVMRDILSAPLMISNDRILGNTANMLLAHRLDSGLAA